LIQWEFALRLFKPFTPARDYLFKNITHKNSCFPRMRLRWLPPGHAPAPWRSFLQAARRDQSTPPIPVQLLTRLSLCRRRGDLLADLLQRMQLRQRAAVFDRMRGHFYGDVESGCRACDE